MDPSRRHPQKALTAMRVNSISVPGRYGDGNGLYLVADPSGAKRWVLRTVVHGKRRDIGLGGLRLVSLAEARTKAYEYRKLAREGGDPITARRQAKTTVPTFAEAALSTLEQRRPGWKDEKHPSQWINTLKAYVFPVMGEKRVDQIETACGPYRQYGFPSRKPPVGFVNEYRLFWTGRRPPVIGPVTIPLEASAGGFHDRAKSAATSQRSPTRMCLSLCRNSPASQQASSLDWGSSS
jgi:Arm DNA-binding domain